MAEPAVAEVETDPAAAAQWAAEAAADPAASADPAWDDGGEAAPTAERILNQDEIDSLLE